MPLKQLEVLKRIIRYKVYYDRGSRYWSYVKTLIVIAVAYKVFEDSTIGLFLFEYRAFVIPLTVIVYIGASLILGRLDYKKKIREYEIAEYNKTDPNLRMITAHLKYIKQKLDDYSADSKHSEQGDKP